ncbi:MAG: acetate--CoA ligase family protein [Acidobacteria bacterium]|uniref:Acetate--CoA ligase family protein n=1 Tax=Candidatus Polarisedimenticola svalbardensis TaxID=2886004 RepID=A0A8J6Y733_9BACT|nr:acetate--CoA ligase family protein [Candidatus Polarisedimenticola svalbardensis]
MPKKASKKKTPKKQATTASKKRRDLLDGLFRPRSVAVIGASRRVNSIGGEILRALVEFGFSGPVYPVNPGAVAVHSMKTYPTLESIPDPVDLAVIVVPRDHVLGVIEECGRKGVLGVVVITAGFKEVNSEGARLEQEIVKRLEHYNMRMIGPNCMGIINTEPEYKLNASFAATVPERGNVGFISQSGALGEAILAHASENNLGVSMFASMGNKADVSGNDLLEYWERNPDVEVILMYLESFGNPKRFTTLARRITRKKPILTVKAGRTAAGALAASSHTGSIVGKDIATTSLLEQCGVIRVSSLEEMFVKASALANQPIPAGDRIAIVTNAGGPGILCTDSLIGAGIEIPELSKRTRTAIAKVLPPEASTRNPVDMIASADASRYKAVLETVKKDPNVDAIVAIFVSPIMIDAYEVARAIAEAADGTKPILSVFMGKQRSDEGAELLRSRRVPVYRFPEEAASAMSALTTYRKLRERPQGKMVRYKVDRPAAQRVIDTARKAGRTELRPGEVRELLAAYRFPLAPARTAATAAEAIEAAMDLGYPVVLKIESEKIFHKTDVGGVKVDLRNADEVAAAYKGLCSLKSEDPDLRVTVQPMVRGGQEVILGMTRDPQFGPLLMFGLGGIFVEIMKDVAIRIHPLTDEGAKLMIRKIKGYPLLAGYRGEKAVNMQLLVESLLRLSQMVADLEPDLAEMDLNPFIVTPERKNSLIVDARITLTES